MNPVVAIIGRANVGKSTLFNRLVGSRIAIVEDLPGTTRDRIAADIELHEREITLVDTGGMDPFPGTPIAEKTNLQVAAAIADADIIVFLMDIRAGVLATDWEIAEKLRRSEKPIILAANKADNFAIESHLSDFYELGLGTPVAVSAHHDRGTGILLDRIEELLPEQEPEEKESDIPRLALLGRPNVGKSMLLNAMVGEERSIVDSTAGTTRDAIDTVFSYQGQDIMLIDTAGIRRRGKVGMGLEFYSLIRSLRAIARCDIALLVTDASEFITAQDIHIAGYIKEAYKGMVLVINKWDLITEFSKEQYVEHVRRHMKFAAHIPVVFTSALLDKGVNEIMPVVMRIWEERHKQLPNSVIDKLVQDAVISHAPPRKGNRRLDIIRAYQDGINPPSFSFLVNDPALAHFSYQRYLENRIRQTFGFSGTSLRLFFKKAPRRRPPGKGERLES